MSGGRCFITTVFGSGSRPGGKGNLVNDVARAARELFRRTVAWLFGA
jgi:hypothetical protein